MFTIGFDTQRLRKTVAETIDADYGDFMRVANVHLNLLREELRLLNDRNINHRLETMQMYLQFTPDWDVESTRQRLMADIKYIDDLLKGHIQDWESASGSWKSSELSNSVF